MERAMNEISKKAIYPFAYAAACIVGTLGIIAATVLLFIDPDCDPFDPR